MFSFEQLFGVEARIVVFSSTLFPGFWYLDTRGRFSINHKPPEDDVKNAITTITEARVNIKAKLPLFTWR